LDVTLKCWNNKAPGGQQHVHVNNVTIHEHIFRDDDKITATHGSSSTTSSSIHPQRRVLGVQMGKASMLTLASEKTSSVLLNLFSIFLAFLFHFSSFDDRATLDATQRACIRHFSVLNSSKESHNTISFVAVSGFFLCFFKITYTV
jgi:hypothetical protein